MKILVIDDERSIRNTLKEILEAENYKVETVESGKQALELIDKMKTAIKNKGYVIISGFTIDDPLYKKRNNHTHCFFEPQELKKIFSDFNIIEYKEEIIKDKGHPGNPEPHTHGIVKMIAQKIKNIPK